MTSISSRRPPPRLAAAAALVAGLAALFAAPGAARATDCTTLPNPVYVAGSTAAKPLLAEIGRVMAAQSPPATIVYQGQGSCSGVGAILNGTALRSSATATFSTWTTDGTEQTCDVAADGPGVVADIGMSDVFATTCVGLPGGLPSNVSDFLGPVQTMTFVVPAASAELSISAEAAYYVFGFGADSGVDPWTDEDFLFVRDNASGTQRMIGAAIGVDPGRWRGTVASSSGDLVSRLMKASAPAQAIGILAADVAQDNHGVLNVLAYQHTGQLCGFYPDHDSGSNEKINVRDGHYAIWGPLHMLTHLDNNGLPIDRNAADVIGYMTGTKGAPPGLDLVDLEAQRHVVPPCAMRVKRVEEMGPMASFAPPGACGCYYEKAANGVTACTPCNGPSDCPVSAPICSYGYCETQ
jgi:ABC-type phosphate transport system substrate-binding protein